MSSASFLQVERVADQIGAAASLRLHAFFGGTGRACYVPMQPTPGHILEKLLGAPAFADLCRAFGGQTLHVPMVDLSPLRNAGRVWFLSNKNLSQVAIAGLLDLSPGRVSQILKQLRLEGSAELAEELTGTGTVPATETEGGEL